MLYDGDIFEGRRIVSEEYVKKATSIMQKNKEGGYGYYYWKYEDGFCISGKWKQKCYVLPQRKMIITFLSDIRDDSDDLIVSVERHLING